MIELIPLLVILVAEFVGDFLLQSREIALSKSSNLKSLGKHLFAIFMCMAATGLGFGLPAVYLAGCYIVIHGVQDWFIWRAYKARLISRLGFDEMDLQHPPIKEELERFQYWEDKAFYDTIGLDRLLHVLSIIVLYGVFFL